VTRARLLGSLAATLLLAASAAAAPLAASAEISPRVVNGRDPVAGEVSALVYVRAGGSVCSGTLVDPTHVITAGHCAHARSASSFSVGTTSTGFLPITAWSPVSAVAVHPDYDNSTFANDIAVLTLTIPVAGATPMPLTTARESRSALRAGSAVRSAGFGYVSERGPLSNRALVADLTVVPDRVCANDEATYDLGGVTFTGLGVDTSYAVCAIGVRSDSTLIIDTCQGDSGGPLFAETPAGPRLVGLVSGGVGCAGFEGGSELATKTPGIYTRIAPFLPWLNGIGVRSTPAAPALSAASVGTDGLAVSFVPGQGTTPTGYRAVASGEGGDFACTTTSDACTIAGMTPGATYTVTGFALSGTSASMPSSPITAIAGLPTAKPSKPRIDSASVTPGKRLAVKVSRADEFAWTTTSVICTAGDQVFRAEVLDGRAVLEVPRGQEYRCFAKSSNAIGGIRSKPVRIEV